MSLAWFIARRYLAARKKGRLLSLITWIALGGVTVGVTALIVVIAVMTGLQEDLRDKILGTSPHVLVLQQGSSLRMDRWREVVDTVHGVDGVVAASPFILTQVGIIARNEYAQTGDLYGIDVSSPGRTPVTDMEAGILADRYSLRPGPSGLPPLIMGTRLADRLGVFAGDTLTLVSLENVPIGPFGYMPIMRPFELTATFSTGMYEYDIRNVYAPLEAVQDLLRIRDQVSGIGVRVEDAWRAAEVARAIALRLGHPYWTEDWMATNRSLFSALKLEKLAMAVILFLIVLVAAFNIISTLVMVVTDKTREIGILKAMGMTEAQVLQVFMLQGLWIGVIGTVLGSVLGFVVVFLLDRYRFITLPPDVYFIDRLPVALEPLDVVVIVLISVAIAFAATIYPALQASRLAPVEAIHHE
ncbi:MAG: ABC transporter permease [Gemmatimonadetes bacterium]|nr:ABC transporter permease [Gemmatimonadota bacterium]